MTHNLTPIAPPASNNQYYSEHIELVLRSFKRCTGKELFIPPHTQQTVAEVLFHAPFVLVSHGTEDSPVFNYANQTALDLFGMTWKEFTQLPSLYSAEPMTREERADLLAEVEKKGFIDNYHGIRIAKDGQRFMIKDVTVWNLVDEDGQYQGQAAHYTQWAHIKG